jgi:hypothetical protein
VKIAEYTTEELLALARGLGLRDPMLLRRPPISEWSAQVRSEVERIGWRSLFARGLVDLDDDRAEIPDVVADLVRTLSDASLMVHVARIDASVVSAATYWATPRLCAGHRVTRSGNHAFTLFAADLTRDVVLEASAIPDREPVDAEAVEVSIEELQDAIGGGLGTEGPRVTAALCAAGLPRETAEALAGAVSDETTTTAVCVAGTSDPHTVEGALVVWIDAVHHGLWLVERASSEGTASPPDVHIRLVPASPTQLESMIVEALPAWSGVVTAVRAG